MYGIEFYQVCIDNAADRRSNVFEIIYFEGNMLCDLIF